MTAARAGPALAPAQRKQRRPALLLRPVTLPELGLAQPFHPPPQPAFRAHALAPHHPKPARILAQPRMDVTDNQDPVWVLERSPKKLSFRTTELEITFQVRIFQQPSVLHIISKDLECVAIKILSARIANHHRSRYGPNT